MAKKAARRAAPLRTRPLSRDAVVSAARKIVAGQGYEALSLRGLASRLGVTAPALYAYVDDKLDLLEAVAAGEFERLTREYDAIRVRDPIERLRLISHTYLDYARSNPELFRMMFLFPPHSDVSGDVPPGARAFRSAASSVEDAIASGRLREGDPTRTSVAIWSAVHGVASLVLTGSGVRRAEEDQTLDFVFDAIIAGLTPG